MLTTFTASLKGKNLLTHDIYFLRFELDKPLFFNPGQYLIFKIPKGTETVSRIFSIASWQDQTNSVEIIAEYIPGGIASEHFKAMDINDTLTIQAPAGMFTFKCDDVNQNITFMVTGTGIAPVRSILHSLLNSHIDSQMLLLWGVRTYDDVYFLEEIKILTSQIPRFSFKICLSREVDLSRIPADDQKYFSIGRVHVVDEELNSNFPYRVNEIQNSKFYVCGARDTVESLRQYLYQKGVQKEHVIFEKF